MGDHIILSKTRFHQGDQLAGLLFSLVLHPVILIIQSRVPSLKVNAWYLDDGIQMGRRHELQEVVDIIKEFGPDRGLHLSTAKSTVWLTPDFVAGDDPLARNIPRLNQTGFVLLGTPIGDVAFTQETIIKRINKVKEITEKLPLLKDGHTQFALLRSCLSVPKVMYTLRTTDPTLNQVLWQEVDTITREACNRILGAPVNDTQWMQAMLPVSMGGLGLKSAADHSTAAYITSVLSSQDLKQQILGLPEQSCPPKVTDALLEMLTAKQGEEATLDSIKIDRKRLERLSEHISSSGVVRDIARLASLSLPHAGDLLNVRPCPALGLHLTSAEFSISARYRLGAPVYITDGECPACHQYSDKEGDHAISCGSKGERIARHNHLRDHLYHTAVCSALSPTREDRAIIPGSDARPADVLIPNWTGGKDTALDVTVVNPLQTQLVSRAATHAGHALEVRYSAKMT